MLKLDKDIPRPNRRYGFNKSNQKIYDHMVAAEVGHSFVPENPGKSLPSFVSRQGFAMDKKFSISHDDDGKIRIWRIK